MAAKLDAEALVARCFPDTWADELANELVATWTRANRRRAPRAVLDRVASEWRTSIRPRLRVPAALRPRLLREARRQLAAGEAARAIEAALDALVDDAVTPVANRVAAGLDELGNRLDGEAARHAEATKVHRYVMRNWRNYSAEGSWEIVARDDCALGTALLIYWLGTPHYYRQYVARREAASHERKQWDLLRHIEKSVAQGELPHASIAFDPRTWQRGGDDWTRDRYAALPRRTELPRHMWIRTTATGIEPLASPKPSIRRRRA